MRSTACLLGVKQISVTMHAWIQMSLAEIDDLLLRWASILHRLVVKGWKLWLNDISCRKRCLSALLRFSQVALCPDGSAQPFGDAPHLAAGKRQSSLCAGALRCESPRSTA